MNQSIHMFLNLDDIMLYVNNDFQFFFCKISESTVMKKLSFLAIYIIQSWSHITAIDDIISF